MTTQTFKISIRKLTYRDVYYLGRYHPQYKWEYSGVRFSLPKKAHTQTLDNILKLTGAQALYVGRSSRTVYFPSIEEWGKVYKYLNFKAHGNYGLVEYYTIDIDI